VDAITEILGICVGIKSVDIELAVERIGHEAGILTFAFSPAEIAFPSNKTLSNWTGLFSK
jgi:hypothetical protein